jgi:SAM-dependent methyltransferase
MSDKSWEKFGKDDPYFAVATHEKYRNKNLNEEALEDFFASGEEHVELLLKAFRQKFNYQEAFFKNVLDFGCGTGRLVIPFAKRAEKVTGIDISQPMLAEAEKNLQKRNIGNVELIQSGDITQLNFPLEFDLVHTSIVLQHIPTNIGYTIIDRLISFTREGGYGMIHFTFANNKSSLRNKLAALRDRYTLTRGLWNVARGKSFSAPVMQMNNYNLEKVFRILISHHLKQTSLEFTDHGHLGVNIYYQK